jgi:hypothetical protein
MLDTLLLRMPAAKKRNTCSPKLRSIRQWISHSSQIFPSDELKLETKVETENILVVARKLGLEDPSDYHKSIT